MNCENSRWRELAGVSRPPGARDALERLIKDYPASNRAGCALLYLARQSSRAEREAKLKQAISFRGRMLVMDHLRPALTGIAAGLLVSWWTRDALGSLMYRLDSGDVRLWILASGVLVSVVAAATWLPARRATGANPALVLRAE